MNERRIVHAYTLTERVTEQAEAEVAVPQARIRWLPDATAGQVGVELREVIVRVRIRAIGRAEIRRHFGRAGMMRRQIEQRDLVPGGPRQTGRRNHLPHGLVESDGSLLDHLGKHQPGEWL